MLPAEAMKSAISDIGFLCWHSALANWRAELRRAVFYLRVSTLDQTTANQERELRAIAARMGCEVVKVYKDHGISGAKGRNGRPAFDALSADLMTKIGNARARNNTDIANWNHCNAHA